MKKYFQYIVGTLSYHWKKQILLSQARVKWIIHHLGDSSNSLQVINASIVKCKFGVSGKDNLVKVCNGADMFYTSIQIDGDGNEIILDGCRGILNITLHGNGCKVIIGKGSSFEDSYIVCMGKQNSIMIGENCMFSGKTEFWNSDTHLISTLSDDTPCNPSRPIHIGNHVWGGKSCKLLKGVTIGNHSIIGMDAVVTHDVPANSIVAGNPAKVVKSGVTWHHGFIEI